MNLRRLSRLTILLFTLVRLGAPHVSLAEADAEPRASWNPFRWLAPARNESGPPVLLLGPMIGHTTSTDARVWAKASGSARLTIRVSERPDLSRSRHFNGPSLSPNEGHMGHVTLSDLKPATRYYYALYLDNRRAMSAPYPSFTTAPPEGGDGRLRFAFISCLGKQGFLPAASWGDMVRTNFDLVLFLGDNHYADTTDPERLRAAFYDHRQHGAFRDIASRVPSYAIWDDHDYAGNNSDGTATNKADSLKVFKEHWANPAYGEPENPGVYFKFTRNNVDFFMLDVRYHRTPNLLTNAPNRTMLGPVQLAWLKAQLLASAAPVKVVAAGSEWQSQSTEDCWSSFMRERDEILQFIQDSGITGVLLISGDRHFTAAYQVKGQLIEVTSGPMGSSTVRAPIRSEMFLNPGEGRMYCVYDIETGTGDPKVTLEVYRTGDGLVERRAFTWDEVLGHTKIPALPPRRSGR